MKRRLIFLISIVVIHSLLWYNLVFLKRGTQLHWRCSAHANLSRSNQPRPQAQPKARASDRQGQASRSQAQGHPRGSHQHAASSLLHPGQGTRLHARADPGEQHVRRPDLPNPEAQPRADGAGGHRPHRGHQRPLQGQGGAPRLHDASEEGASARVLCGGSQAVTGAPRALPSEQPLPSLGRRSSSVGTNPPRQIHHHDAADRARSRARGHPQGLPRAHGSRPRQRVRAQRGRHAAFDGCWRWRRGQRVTRWPQPAYTTTQEARRLKRSIQMHAGGEGATPLLQQHQRQPATKLVFI